MTSLVTPFDAWQALRQHTRARIAIGRSGGSLPTRELLAFGHAYAQARDAVYAELDVNRLASDLARAGSQVLTVTTQATDRETYLRRPDLGRRLSTESRLLLQQVPKPNDPFDLSIVVGDGLSACAVQLQAAEIVASLVKRLTDDDWSLAPLCIARQTRVAISDEIGEILNARIGLILLGERPGLGTADSVGAYLVYRPRVGRSDAERNCVSNIRPEGLSVSTAVELLYYLLTNSRTRCLSGIELKDDRGLNRLPETASVQLT